MLAPADNPELQAGIRTDLKQLIDMRHRVREVQLSPRPAGAAR